MDVARAFDAGGRVSASAGRGNPSGGGRHHAKSAGLTRFRASSREITTVRQVVQTILSDVNEYISLIATRRSQVSRYLAKELAKEISTDATLIRDAAPLTKSLLKSSLDLEGAAKKLTTLSEETQEKLDAATEIAKSFDELKDSAEEAHKIVLERQTETERFHAEALSFRNKAEEEASKFELRLVGLEKETDVATDLLTQSRAELNIALSDVKRSGLASAFTGRAMSIKYEKYIWLFVFVFALAALTSLAIVFAVDLTNFTYEQLLVSLLRRISLAAPAVWLGWYAAKQVSRLNLIQEDYEYKAATALAFESYNNEVEDSGDSELVKELLKTTIKNFGDNPVRLYESPEKVAATPTQELIQKLESDGTLTLMQRLKSMASS